MTVMTAVLSIFVDVTVPRMARREPRLSWVVSALMAYSAFAFFDFVFFAGAASVDDAPSADADFCACFSRPLERPLRMVRMRAMSRRFVVMAAVEVTWLVY